jgi:hypothetical protein
MLVDGNHDVGLQQRAGHDRNKVGVPPLPGRYREKKLPTADGHLIFGLALYPYKDRIKSRYLNFLNRIHIRYSASTRVELAIITSSPGFLIGSSAPRCIT